MGFSTKTKIGNTVFSSNGKSYTKIGNTWFGSNGGTKTKVGNTYFGQSSDDDDFDPFSWE